MKNNLSVTIITLNEEKDITRCLKTVKNFAAEVVVVDSGSTDKTVEIAKKFGAKVYYRKFDNYASQKNFAASKAKNEWVLSLDGDEVVTPGLALEISSKLQIPNDEYCAYSIPRKNIILGKFIRYSRWQAELDRHIWLWKKDKGRWVGEVHEEVIVRGKVGRLRNPKIHHQYDDITEFIAMMNRYSELDADRWSRMGRKFSFERFFLEPLYNFLTRYFYRLGFLDGWRGFCLSYMMAIYHLEVWVKIWERQRS